ncbi:alpha/beta fold hydrolase [Ornithinimicrobium murale]|uniref:alpha/beta fold hydrolase n=1 Tax=Ornithinimicrobium murale TaxID=1050153 RepID=UPI000E0CDCE4|nr:alpha/beta hydrolase [Ornithinimicrobium murale]
MRCLLVPGAGGQAWYWHRLVPLLPGAAAVELPAGDPNAGLAAYADAIVSAAGPDPGPVTVVAQSMGGLSAPLVCDRLDVRELVLLNAMIPRPGETGHQWWTATRLAEEMIEEMDPLRHFFHDVPEDVTQEALAAGEPAQTDRPFDEPWPLPAWPEVPTRVLTGSDDRFFPPAFQRRVARERLGLEVELVPGGHLAALSRPTELAAALLRTVQT